MPLEYRKRISRSMLVNEADTLFVFGDNLLRKGRGGQAAEMRGEPNAVGVPTKKAPSNAESAFFSDNDFDDAIKTIEGDLKRIADHLRSGGNVVWPSDGIGTGLADLPRRAPKIWEYLEERRQCLEAMTVDN